VSDKKNRAENRPSTEKNARARPKVRHKDQKNKGKPKRAMKKK